MERRVGLAPTPPSALCEHREIYQPLQSTASEASNRRASEYSVPQHGAGKASQMRKLSAFRRSFLVTSGRAKETPAVFAGHDESLDHFSSLNSCYRYLFITCIFTRLCKRVHLREPEIVTAEVGVGSVVRVTPQVPVVLHQHEGVVVEFIEDRAALNDTLESRRPTRSVATAVRRNGIVAFSSRGRRPGIQEEFVHIGGSGNSHPQ